VVPLYLAQFGSRFVTVAAPEIVTTPPEDELEEL
jgi:hypothetical protein